MNQQLTGCVWHDTERDPPEPRNMPYLVFSPKHGMLEARFKPSSGGGYWVPNILFTVPGIADRLCKLSWASSYADQSREEIIGNHGFDREGTYWMHLPWKVGTPSPPDISTRDEE